MKLSVVIPAHNEEGCIAGTVTDLSNHLKGASIEHELCVVNDNSQDNTGSILRELQKQIPELKVFDNSPPHGFGFAVRHGLENFTGDVVAVVMADASDKPADVVTFYKTLVGENLDCVFGSRFMKGSRVEDYPWVKLVLNRLANTFIQLVFGLRYNDVTNAFKMYRRCD